MDQPLPRFADLEWGGLLYAVFIAATVSGIFLDRKKVAKRRHAAEANEIGENKSIGRIWSTFFLFLNDQAVDAAILAVLIGFAFLIEYFEHYVRPEGWIFFKETASKSFRFDDFLDLLDMSAVLYIVHRAVRRIFNVLPFD